jgi:hypothetical protein
MTRPGTDAAPDALAASCPLAPGTASAADGGAGGSTFAQPGTCEMALRNR